jgi:hypothetical protein
VPTLCFFPWATITEPLQFGDFHLVPFGAAMESKQIPEDLAPAAAVVLGTYRQRPAGLDAVPLLHQAERDIVADLKDEQMVDYFDFRTRLTFAVLAAREFFTHRYTNGDHVRLVVQRFTREQAGGAAVLSRRRDGSHMAYISREMWSVPKPHHVNGACELPRDLDQGLLAALEAVHGRDARLAARIADTARLFVGANTDGPDVSPHMELIDVVSAFGRLADEWKAGPVADAFMRDLPAPVDEDWKPSYGPKVEDPHFKKARAEGRPVRRVWLNDAIALRHQCGHGHIHQPHTKTWTLHEHLLLSAVALPLYAKALLQKAGMYAFTERDATLNLAFDTLTTVEPLAECDEGDPNSVGPWREVLGRAEDHGFVLRAAKGFAGTPETDA